MIVMGIETSCDDTAASVVVDGREVLSDVVSSQNLIHHPYGGVVPELASRKHVEAITPVVNASVKQSGLNIKSIDGIAVTRGPGLKGSLLVGFCFAKSVAFALNIPWIGVNHLKGHLNSVFLDKKHPEFPFVALLASGGHTGIYHVCSHTNVELMGQTRDDAAGEAFDKVAKMLGFGYPGGSIISSLAEGGDPEKIHFPRSYLDKFKFDFSFSGIKTSVNRYIQTHDAAAYEGEKEDIAAGFQEAVVEVLCFKLINAAKEKGCRQIAIVGGVAANNRLREKIILDAKKNSLEVFMPGLNLCGDNGAMIAALGYHYLKEGKTSDFDCDVYSRSLKG